MATSLAVQVYHLGAKPNASISLFHTYIHTCMHACMHTYIHKYVPEPLITIFLFPVDLMAVTGWAWHRFDDFGDSWPVRHNSNLSRSVEETITTPSTMRHGHNKAWACGDARAVAPENGGRDLRRLLDALQGHGNTVSRLTRYTDIMSYFAGTHGWSRTTIHI